MSGMKFEKDGFHYIVPAVDVTEVYNDGIACGMKECEKKHYIGFVKGTGGESLVFPCQFDPDSIFIFNFNDLASATADDAIAIYVYDRTSTGTYCGLSYAWNKSTKRMKDPIGYGTSGGAARYERNEAEGTVTIKGVTNGGDTSVNNVFDKNLTYTVICEKHA